MSSEKGSSVRVQGQRNDSRFEDRHKPIQDNWLLAHFDSTANLLTHSACICFADLNGDGDQKLVIGDLADGVRGMKLNIYGGTLILSQITLIDVPCGVISFYMESNEPRTPAIAVASGPFLYIYKDLKPFYKFSLPSLEIYPSELEAWEKMAADQIDATTLRETLTSFKIGDSNLTSKSQVFLEMASPEAQLEFLETYKHIPLKRSNIITCVATIKKTVEEESNLNCIVIGTENKDIFIIEPDAFTILASVQLPSVPVFLEVSGLFNVEYRIIVSCRDASVYVIERGFKTGRLCVQLNSQPLGLTRINNNVIVATMDRSFSSFSSSGNRIWKVSESSSITAIGSLEIEILGLALITIALESKRVFFYNGKTRVDMIETDSVITSLKFGRYGREENTLVMVSRGGDLVLKILKRTAKFLQIDSDLSLSMSSSPRFDIPRTNKLMMDQALREKDEAVAIHRTFQHDLYRLRLLTARSYAKVLTSNMNPINSNSLDPLKLSAQVHGLGPIFRLILEVQNTSIDQPSIGLSLYLSADAKVYRISRKYIPIPFLTPGLIHSYSTRVECISELNVSDLIKVFVLRKSEINPLIIAIINMPFSENPV